MKKSKLAKPNFKETEEQKQFLRRYRESLTKVYHRADFAGLSDLPEDVPVALQSIYVPLLFSPENMEKKSEYKIDTYKKTLNIATLMQAHQSVVLLGGPGSGKTTLTRFLSWALSHPDMTYLSTKLGQRLVIPFILRNYSNLSDLKSFDNLLVEYCAKMQRVFKWEQKGLKLDPDLLMFYLANGWAFIIFDGLDEVGSLNLRKKIRRWIVEDLWKITDVNTNMILATSRPAGYDECPFDQEISDDIKTQVLDDGSTVILHMSCQYPNRFYVMPFSESQQENFSDKWHNLRE
ncbi:NACHT domain-containing protein, partial [bacterium]|nr:NACHT domain-containing protein [bacterium]